jgi:hypothetical protein
MRKEERLQQFTMAVCGKGDVALFLLQESLFVTVVYMVNTIRFS